MFSLISRLAAGAKAFTGAVICAAAFVAAPSSAFAAFYPTYTLTTPYNIGPYLLLERGTPPGESGDTGPYVTRADNNGNFYTTPGTSTIVSGIDPGLSNFRSMFISVSNLIPGQLPGLAPSTPPNHLILGVTNLYSGTLIGQEFTDIFSRFDEASLINAVLTVADLNLGNAQPGQENEPEFTEAFSLLYDFEAALRSSSTFDPYFRVNEGFNVVAFSRGTSIGAGTFTAASAVPEPATWAMMIGGLGLVGGVLRRRRSIRNVSVSYA